MTIEIEIPKKTYELYTTGERTFIHIPRDNESFNKQKESLEFGCEVIIKNSETKESITEIFWHLFDMKECDRFYILVFAWNTKHPLFFKRKQVARRKREIGLDLENKEYFLVYPK